MAIKKLINESYTMYPNQLLDRIRPKLTDAQKTVVDIVVRQSYGWQATSARISNTTFVKKSRMSERSIITAKKVLLAIGLLIMLEAPKSGKPGLYTLDLYYDDPSRSIKKQKELQVDKNSVDTHVDAGDLLEGIANTPAQVPLSDVPTTPAQSASLDNVVTTTGDESTTINDNINSSSQNDILIPPPTTQHIESYKEHINNNNAPNTPIPHDSISIPLSATDTTVSLPPVTNDSPMSIPDSISDSPDSITVGSKPNHAPNVTEKSSVTCTYSTLDIYINKQTEETAATKLPTATNVQAIRDVCYNFTLLFPEAKDDSTYKFMGWCVKNYGVEACMCQIDYLKEYRKLHPVHNPKGLFRESLSKGYVAGRWITGMIKARKKADLAYQQSQAMLVEWETAEVNYDFTGGSAKLKDIIAMLDAKEKEDNAHI